MEALTFYKFAGLRIVSELPLPGLAPYEPDDHSTSDEIVIRRARVPETLLLVRAAFPNGECNENELLLKFPKVGKYLLRRGNEILVEQAPSSDLAELRGYLLGTVLGLLCHQRGITPLHASAIDVAGACIAFIGESGAGKSTLVAALAARGYDVIADDVCFLQSENGAVQAWPGVQPRIRLWEDAMIALGRDGPGVEREVRGYNKYLIPMKSPRNATEPRRLRRVYQLHAAGDDDGFSISRLHGADAIEVLMQNVYRLGIAEYMGHKPAAFVVCATAARDIPVFRFSRSLDFDTLGKRMEILENHMRDVC